MRVIESRQRAGETAEALSRLLGAAEGTFDLGGLERLVNRLVKCLDYADRAVDKEDAEYAMTAVERCRDELEVIVRDAEDVVEELDDFRQCVDGDRVLLSDLLESLRNAERGR